MMNSRTNLSRATGRRFSALLLQLAIGAMALTLPSSVFAADTAAGRAIKQRVAPVYPDLAKRMHISGAVRVSATVAPDGSVSATKTVSGNRLLAGAAEDAVHKWKFATASEESTVEVEINFSPAQ